MAAVGVTNKSFARRSRQFTPRSGAGPGRAVDLGGPLSPHSVDGQGHSSREKITNQDRRS